MAEVKNSFIKSKMNQDLDDRLIPNGEYREAFNVSVNKSVSDNVGTLQTVLGNESLIDFDTLLGKSGLEVIGVYSDDVSGIIYSFLTNNTRSEYVPTGAVNTLTLTSGGTGYDTTPATGQTSTTGGGTGLIVSVQETGGVIDTVNIVRFGSGYNVGDTVTILGGNADATINIDSILPSWGAIVSFNTQTQSTKIIAQGTWLNFSTLNPITGISLLEDLLFFTDNRNQPRKVNVTYNTGYYTTEDQLSVAKYYPFESIELYQPSELSSAVVVSDTTSSAVNNSTTIPLTTGSTDIKVSQGLVGSEVGQNVFVTDTTNLPTSIEVNIPQTLTSGASLDFVYPETTMQDAINEDLGPSATANVKSVISSTTFEIATSSFLGALPLIGQDIYLQLPNGSYSDLGVSVINVSTGTNVLTIEASGTPSTALNPLDTVKFAIENPYYDQDFASKANLDYLEDKFVRFSYRFKFDDGEYSLIAPFTQPCFIPKQDGYFLKQQVGGDIVTDEEKALRSTEVEFMENKVNKILLNIPLPYTANNLGTSLKVTEIDVLYKESDKVAIKVVDTIPLTNNVTGDSEYYQYEYGSKAPFKTLPESESTRVFDKVPVKALSQEIASNRVIYGNYQDKHTPPQFLDYILGATEKSTFYTSQYKSETKSSEIEYPNATLKQNRNYEVGIVLADKFGRQSTPIFSRTDLSGSPSFLSSTIFSDYKTKFDSPSNLSNFDGNSLKIQFNQTINGSYTGSPGLYNGDPDSQDYNPLGWYSYKVVVKQTQQEYYNAYVPTAMAAYPLDSAKELGTTSHILLFNDNINKIPRDLTEVGPAQREFRSSVRMFGRVTNYLEELTPTDLASNVQFYPEKTADISTNVATIKDLFDYKQFPDSSSSDYLFYNFDIDNTTSATETLVADSSSLVAKVSTQKQFGAEVPSSGTYANGPFLNVYEIEPVVSLLDIYWETSTSGTISDLNQAINASGPTSFDRIDDWNWYLEEDNDGTDNPVSFFKPVKLDGTQFANPENTTGSIVSIADGAGNSSNANGVLYYDSATPANGIFNIENNLNGTFNIVLNSPGGDVELVYNNTVPTDPNSYTIEMSFNHPDASGATTLTQTGSFCPLTNDLPEITNCPLAVTVSPSQTSGVIYTYEGVNGSSTTSLNQLGLTFQIYSVFENTSSGPVDVTSDTLANPFTLNATSGEMTFTESIARGNSYAVQVRAYDYEGVQPNTAGICETTYTFEILETAETDPLNAEEIFSRDNSAFIGPRSADGFINISGYAQGTPDETIFRFQVQLQLSAVGLDPNIGNNKNGTATLKIGSVDSLSPGDPGYAEDTISITYPINQNVPLGGSTTPISTTVGIDRYVGRYYYEIIAVNIPDQDVTTPSTNANYVEATTELIIPPAPLP
jgi:hypothetical protein